MTHREAIQKISLLLAIQIQKKESAASISATRVLLDRIKQDSRTYGLSTGLPWGLTNKKVPKISSEQRTYLAELSEFGSADRLDFEMQSLADPLEALHLKSGFPRIHITSTILSRMADIAPPHYLVGEMRRECAACRKVEILSPASSILLGIGSTRVKGLTTLQSKTHMIDGVLLCYWPYDVSSPVQLAAKLLFKTGTPLFVSALCAIALQIGWTLKEEGMLPVLSEGETLNDYPAVPQTEDEIFKMLGLPVIPPQFRYAHMLDRYLPDAYKGILRPIVEPPPF